MRAHRVIVSVILSMSLLGVGGSVSIDFAKFDESKWLPAREDRWPSPGKFVQKDGYVTNYFPEGTSEQDLYRVKDGVGFAMRLLKDVEVKDGRAELELALSDRAAPSIVFRAQLDGEVHGELYNLVVFNNVSKKKPNYQGVNLWKWVAKVPEGKWHWQKVAYWLMPIPREKKIKLGVEFKGRLIRVFLNDKEIGGVTDVAALGPGKIGIVAIEGPTKFYSFKVTPFPEKK